MKSNLPVPVVTMAIAAFFTSCISGYMPVDRGNEQHGKAINKTNILGAAFRVQIEEQKDGNVSVTLSFQNVSGAVPIKLEDVKVSLAALSMPSGAYVLQHINLQYTSSHTGRTTLLKTNITPAIAEGSDFDLSEDGNYAISYYFEGSKTDHYPKKNND